MMMATTTMIIILMVVTTIAIRMIKRNNGPQVPEDEMGLHVCGIVTFAQL